MLSAGTDITLTATLTDNAGNALTANTVQMQVSSEDGVLQSFASITPIAIAPGSISFVVPASLNTITDSNTKEARIIDLQVTTTTTEGALQLRLDYILVSTLEQLVVMTNSFQTYGNALLIASEIPDLTAWPDTAYDRRVTAMIDAFRKLSRLNYEIYYDRDDIYFKSRASWGLPWISNIGNLYAYTPTDFANLDPDFQKAIFLAQVAFADDILGGKPELDDRELGYIQKQVGDTMHTFRPQKPLQLTVSKRALKYLSGYVKYSARILRS